jgi:2,4-dienoyl-CoA reductase-like NADH-dependent reductase (Old Yellow Enzyme family)
MFHDEGHCSTVEFTGLIQLASGMPQFIFARDSTPAMPVSTWMESAVSLLFSPLTLPSPRGGLTLANRIVIAPMCQYSAVNGEATDWHLAHWSSLLNSGSAMLTLEATAVTADGRITPACLGLWDERTEQALGDTLHRARQLAPQLQICIQLAHAGRKASSALPWQGGQLLSAAQGGWQPAGPSALPQLPNEPPPTALTLEQLAQIRDAFVRAAQRADRLDIEAIELHAAHGYLLHQFLSPLANQRTDQYGGSFDNRVRFPLEVFAAVRQAFDGVLGLRVSATDWVDGGWDVSQTAQFTAQVKALGCDFVHVSSGGVSPQQKIPVGPAYQVPLARQIRQASGLATMAVGLITEPQQAEDILQAGDADLIALARAFLYKPRWGWEAAAALGGQVTASPQYWRCLPREAQSIFGEVRIGAR